MPIQWDASMTVGHQWDANGTSVYVTAMGHQWDMQPLTSIHDAKHTNVGARYIRTLLRAWGLGLSRARGRPTPC